MDAVIAITLLLVGGLPISLAVARHPVTALLLAPLAAALTTAVASSLMIIVGGTLIPWCAGVWAAQAGIAYSLWRKRRPSSRAPHSLGTIAAAGVLVLPFLLLLRQPVAWDAHSIWWLHAGYFTHGATFARDAIADPAYAFSHVDYPPLSSSTVAAIWSLLGTADFRIAQLVTGVLNFSAIALLVFAVRTVTVTGRALAGWLAAVGVGLATWALDPFGATNGYSDVLYSAAAVAAAILLLVGRDPLDQLRLPLLLLAVAALTKNEGLVLVLLVTVATILRHGRGLFARTPDSRRRWGRVVLLCWPAAAGLAWMAVIRGIGGSSDLAEQGRFGDLLAGDLNARGRLSQIFDAYAGRAGMIILAATLIAVLGMIFLRSRRHELEIGSDAWIWLVAAVHLATVTATYVITPYDLKWHLATSAARVLLPVVLLLAASGAVWMVVASTAPSANPSDDREPAATDHPSAPMVSVTEP